MVSLVSISLAKSMHSLIASISVFTLVFKSLCSSNGIK